MDSYHSLGHAAETQAVVKVRIDGETFATGPLDADRARDLADSIHTIPSATVSDAMVERVGRGGGSP